MKFIEGGVTAAKGFKAAGTHCGIRQGRTKNDIALIASDVACTAAGLFTKNQVKAAPVQLDIKTIKSGKGQAIAANSGIANACAPNDMESAIAMQKAAAEALGIDQELVLVGFQKLIL